MLDRPTANVFFNKHSLCENIPTLTNHLSSLLVWLTLRGRGNCLIDKWGPEYTIFSHEYGLKFSTTVDILLFF